MQPQLYWNSAALAVAVGSSALVVLLWGYLDLYVGAVKGACSNAMDIYRERQRFFVIPFPYML
jgi:hypothetical protein